MRYMAFFNRDLLRVEVDQINNLILLHDLRMEKDGLRECKHFSIPMVPGQKPVSHVLFQRLNGGAMVMHEVDGPWQGRGAIVIKVPDVTVGKELHLCPVCGSKGPFEVFPTVKHVMKWDGTLTRRLGAKARNWDDILTFCPDCSFHDQKLVFNTSKWITMNGVIACLTEVPI